MMFSFGKVLPVMVIALLVLSCSRSEASRAALVHAGLPGEDSALVSLLSTQIEAAGYDVTQLDANELCDHAVLNAEAFDLLVLPNAADLPVKAVGSISDYARAGGDIIALNAPLWQRVLINVDGKWTTHDDYQRANAGKLPDHVLFDFSNTNGWQRTSNKMESPTTYETDANGPAGSRHALHASISDLTGWDSFGIRGLQNPFPKGHTLTVFSAKGSERTSQLAVEWSEKDGSRWFAVIPLYPEWRQYVLTPNDFHYWTSTEGRGGRGDSFRPDNAQNISFGLAFSHTGFEGGRHEFWVGPVGTAPQAGPGPQAGSTMLGTFDLPALDTLSPGYKFFDVHGAVSFPIRQDQAIVETGQYSTVSAAGDVRSPHPRPGGGGFDKRRDWRWIPIVEAESKDRQWRGTPVTMMVNAEGRFKGGVWASFGLAGSDIYRQPAVLSTIKQIAEKMRDGAFILDGGANFYTYFADQDVTLGVRACNVGSAPTKTLTARVIVMSPELKKPAIVKQWRFTLQPGETKSVSATWRPKMWPAGGFTVLTELLRDGRVIDTVTHKINVWQPKHVKHFITVKDGEFTLNGKRWRANGVNYMPSSGIGTEDGEFFEHWIGARSYDPEIIDRDLDHIKAMGLNSISAFVYTGYAKDQNMLDLLRRLDKRSMKANIGLRPGMPDWFNADDMKNVIKQLRLAENDTVFAYDVAWEPMFGTNNERKVWDGEWEKWIVERYGSIASAEKDWGFAVPRNDDGTVTNPLPHQIDTNGEWRKMTAAYRRFLDTLLYKKYGEARRVIRSVDPNHAVSFRMAEAGNPGYRWDGRIPYDFPYLAAAVDIIEPEAYGRIGDWERVKPGWFEFAYAKWAAPAKPVIWAEMGVSAWELSRMKDTPQKLDYQAMFYKAFYRLLTSSGANGVFFWWYPGGFRTGENSDYGIINPDGTDKPVTSVIRENSKGFLDGPSIPKTNYWIEIDRDAHPDGIAGIYDQAKADFWAAIDKGLAPGLKTAGTGTDSSNCPLVAVGNGPLTGSNPPKYLDAAIDSVQILDANGKWVEVTKGGSVKVKPGATIDLRTYYTNLGEATLLGLGGPRSDGVVWRTMQAGSWNLDGGIPLDVPHLGSGCIQVTTRLPDSVRLPVEMVIGFEAKGRAKFGERFGFTIEP